MCESEGINMYFYASAIVTVMGEWVNNATRSNEETRNEDRLFILDHYPSRDEVKQYFDRDTAINVDIMSLQQWTGKQYYAWY